MCGMRACRRVTGGGNARQRRVIVEGVPERTNECVLVRTSTVCVGVCACVVPDRAQPCRGHVLHCLPDRVSHPHSEFVFPPRPLSKTIPPHAAPERPFAGTRDPASTKRAPARHPSGPRRNPQRTYFRRSLEDALRHDWSSHPRAGARKDEPAPNRRGRLGPGALRSSPPVPMRVLVRTTALQNGYTVANAK